MNASQLTRRTALVGAASIASAAAIPAAARTNPWAPTDLGRKVLTLMPMVAEAAYAACNVCSAKWLPEYDAAAYAAAMQAEHDAAEALEAAVRAIIERPASEPAHVTDLVIAYCSDAIEDDDPQQEQVRQAHGALVDGILALAGLEISRPWPEAFYQAHKAKVEGAPMSKQPSYSS